MKEFSDELIELGRPRWDEMLDHPFVKGMTDGTLDKNKFAAYLIQDAIYLKYYGKVYAWGILKTDDTITMRLLYKDMDVITSSEDIMHIVYLNELGYTEERALSQPIHPKSKAYIDYMLSVSENEPLAYGVIGLMPCSLSYYYIASECKKRAIAAGSYQNNYYKSWIDHYSGEDYKACYDRHITLCNRVTADVTEAEKEKLKEIFLRGTEHEWNFWDMAFEPSR